MPTEIHDLDGRLLARVDRNEHGIIAFNDMDLRRANLRGVELFHRPAVHSNLRVGWHLYGTNLSGSDMCESDLRFCCFAKTKLIDAKFDGARLNWCDHTLLAEILRQAAVAEGDPTRLEAASTVLANRKWTWLDVIAFRGPHESWCFEILRPWFRDGDGDRLPEIVRRRLTGETGATAAS
jgi:Pentapeptide repeats (8 copies)